MGMRRGACAGWIAVLVLAVSVIAPAARAADAPRSVVVDGLSATFAMPAGASTAVLIIAGSGAVDRDGNGPGGLATDAYKQLAAALEKAGLATLRFDKRGIGASKTDKSGAPVSEASLTLETSASDVAALIGWLRQQPGITRVVAVGHSEGGLMALKAAESAKIDRLVLLMAAGRPLGVVLRAQFARTPIPEETEAEIMRVIDVIEKGGDPGPMKPPVDQVFRPSVQPFLRSVLAVDPVPLMRAFGSPALVVGGGADLQIGRFDFDALAGARAGIKSHWEPQLTHVLKQIVEGDPGETRPYTDPSLPVMGALVDLIVGFAKE